MKKILVIGGTGTMGKPLVNALFDKGMDVSVVCRKKVNDNREQIKYYYGNAKDLSFIGGVLSEGFDVIVDFCVYSTEEFELNYRQMLDKTKQYVCMSSAAVYADIPTPKNESSPRFMEVDPPEIGTKKYGWYCYEKARIEDILTTSAYKNWTIVRPGTTMNSNHFGWGHHWGADWTLRVIHGNKVIVPTDMLDYRFSLSWGGHVTKMLVALIGNEKAIGETYNVCSPEVYSWRELLDLYNDVFSGYGLQMKIQYVESQRIIDMSANPELEYWYKRARLLDRVFDSHKVYELMNDTSFTPNMKELIKEWVGDYIAMRDTKVDALWHTALLDRIAMDSTSSMYFNSGKSYMKYLMMRYTPSIYNYLFYRKKK